jgi:hypothetical protein
MVHVKAGKQSRGRAVRGFPACARAGYRLTRPHQHTNKRAPKLHA